MNCRFIKNSIITKYLLIFLCLIFIPLTALILISSKYVNQVQRQSAEQYLSSNLNVVSTTIDTILSNLENLHTNLVLDINFTKAIKKLEPYATKELYSDYIQSNLIQDTLLKTSITSNYIYSTYAYSYSANRIFSSKTAWDERFTNYNKEASDWLVTYEQNSLSNPWYVTRSIETDHPILTSYREIKELDVPRYGLVSINVNADVISGFLNQIMPQNTGYCFLFDNQQTYISSTSQLSDSIFRTLVSSIPANTQSGFYSVVLDDEAHYVFYKTSEYNNFTYVVALPADRIETISPIIKYLNIIYFFIVVTMLLLSVFVAFFYLYKPINLLFRNMRQVQGGNFSVRMPPASTYEMGFIHSNFNTMVENINTLIQDNYVKELLSKDAELKVLQSKLNEHFLYNTLDTIHWKARFEHAPKTSSMIFQLADFYRLSLSNGKEFVTIRQIINLIECYLGIQKERFGDSLEFQIEYCEQILDYVVLKYLFQPLVENAVIHGSKNISHTERLEIRFEKKQDFLVFSVKDNGGGLSAVKQQELEEILAQDTLNTNLHFALQTLNTQLKKHYGSDSRLHICSEEANGFLIWFRIPIYLLEENVYDKNDHH